MCSKNCIIDSFNALTNWNFDWSVSVMVSILMIEKCFNSKIYINSLHTLWIIISNENHHTYQFVIHLFKIIILMLSTMYKCFVWRTVQIFVWKYIFLSWGKHKKGALQVPDELKITCFINLIDYYFLYRLDVLILVRYLRFERMK